MRLQHVSKVQKDALIKEGQKAVGASYATPAGDYVTEQAVTTVHLRWQWKVVSLDVRALYPYMKVLRYWRYYWHSESGCILRFWNPFVKLLTCDSGLDAGLGLHSYWRVGWNRQRVYPGEKTWWRWSSSVEGPLIPSCIMILHPQLVKVGIWLVVVKMFTCLLVVLDSLRYGGSRQSKVTT